MNLFIQMHVVKEAQTSSRIEGTQTSMDEALMPIDQIAPENATIGRRCVTTLTLLTWRLASWNACRCPIGC